MDSYNVRISAMDKFTFALFLALVPMSTFEVNGQYSEIQRECLGSRSCYTLHLGPVTSSQAASYCLGINQTLAVIPDQETQDVISRFVGSGTGDDQLAWVGGRRGQGTRWRDVNDGILASQDMISENPRRNDWCSGVRVRSKPGKDGLYARSCTMMFRALCQLPPTYPCGPSQYNISSRCHAVIETTSSWQSAKDACETSYTEGKLAYSVIPMGRLFVPNYPDDRYIWVGFHRASWVWMSSQGDILLNYWNWITTATIGDRTECMVIDLTQNSAWRDTACDVTHSYFICESDSIETTTPSVASSSPKATTQSISTDPSAVTTTTWTPTETTSLTNQDTSTSYSDISGSYSDVTTTPGSTSTSQTTFDETSPDSDFSTKTLEPESPKENNSALKYVIVVTVGAAGILIIVASVCVCIIRAGQLRDRSGTHHHNTKRWRKSEHDHREWPERSLYITNPINDIHGDDTMYSDSDKRSHAPWNKAPALVLNLVPFKNTPR